MLANKVLAEARKAPFDNKRRVTAADDKSHGAVNPYFNTPKSTMATSGFLGDRLNPKAFTSVFKLPKQKGLPEALHAHDIETRTTADASYIEDASDMGISGPAYWFNRLKSGIPGKGGGTKVLNELLKQIDAVNIPLINAVNAYGDFSQQETINWYKKRGFEQFGDDKNLLIYKPKRI